MKFQIFTLLLSVFALPALADLGLTLARQAGVTREPFDDSTGVLREVLA